MRSHAIREVKHIVDLSRAYRRHVHDELSIAHVWSGSTLAWIDGREVPIAGECIVVIPPGIAHACNPAVDCGWEYTLALLDPAACTAGSEVLLAAPYRIMSSTDQLRDVFRALPEAGNGSAQGLLIALGDALRGQAGNLRTPLRSCALRRVMEQLRSHLACPLSLEDLCAVAGLSKYHLVRSFKKAYGLTPHAYHLNLRVNEAKVRLRAGGDLATVALDAGFCDQSHFTRVFTRCVGMPPAAYQKATAIPSKIPPQPRP